MWVVFGTHECMLLEPPSLTYIAMTGQEVPNQLVIHPECLKYLPLHSFTLLPAIAQTKFPGSIGFIVVIRAVARSSIALIMPFRRPMRQECA